MNNNDLNNVLKTDTDGLISYEYLVNNLESLDEPSLQQIADNIARLDQQAQYMASAARYLNAVGHEAYAGIVRNLVALTIDRDREHRYIGDLIRALYGDDYREHADRLAADDNNFRRMYKRLYPESII